MPKSGQISSRLESFVLVTRAWVWRVSMRIVETSGAVTIGSIVKGRLPFLLVVSKAV
jgi:hypothetical protein